jgi:predicted AlkP superfamily pyrophosphatase or phosphodiesterase
MSSTKWLLSVAVAVALLLFWLQLSGQQTAATPKLILVLSVDQMRFDYLDRFNGLYKGGIRKLLDQGAVFSNALYRHANSETGPGHSVILSGRHASHSGIVANSWYDPLVKRSINVVDDPVQRPVGGNGRSASPANFLGFTVGDLLKFQSPESKIVGVSMKDRSAILMGGRRADAAYWFENDGGHFISSTYYMKTAPEWLNLFNERKFADQYSSKVWDRLLSDSAVYEKLAGKDAVEGEWDRKDIIFPHSIRYAPPDSKFYEDFRRTPFADEMILQVGLEAMKAHGLGEDSATDILAIGFSATDVIGHTYGAQSQEVMDQLLRLDLTLQKLFEEINRRVGLANTWVVLTADHGSMPLVELMQEKGIDARRVHDREIEAVVVKALSSAFPKTPNLIANYDSPNFYLNGRAMAECGLRRADVENRVTQALMNTGHFEVIYTHAQILDPEVTTGPFLPLVRSSFFQPRSPHIIAIPKPYIYISDKVGGTGHGTPHDYDRHVPIVFMGTPMKPGRYPAASGPEDIAPTLVQLLGLKGFEKEQDARVLDEMLKGAALTH